VLPLFLDELLLGLESENLFLKPLEEMIAPFREEEEAKSKHKKSGKGGKITGV
jgi:hypothetical protein